LQSRAFVEISAIAWYEFLRGPRSPYVVAVARAVFGEGGVLVADLAIAIGRRATLLTHNPRDYAGIEGLTQG
jgi:hypothetical protein